MTNSDNFKLSVVIPAYNCANHIEETIASVLNQTRKPFEILVINDGSTDNTAEIVSKYTQIKLINKPNQGASATRNRGILESSGNWIAFLDSDDIWHTEKIQRVEEYVNSHDNVDMLSTAFFIGNGKDWQKITPRRLYNQNDSFFEQLYRRSFIATSSVVIKKDFLIKANGFDTTLLVAEDLDLFLRLSLMNAKLHYFKEHLLYYRSHAGSITANPINAYHNVLKVFYKYRHQAGYTLFLRRLFVWTATTGLALYRQRRYSTTMYFLLGMLMRIIISPAVYWHKGFESYTPRAISTKSH